MPDCLQYSSTDSEVTRLLMYSTLLQSIFARIITQLAYREQCCRTVCSTFPQKTMLPDCLQYSATGSNYQIVSGNSPTRSNLARFFLVISYKEQFCKIVLWYNFFQRSVTTVQVVVGTTTHGSLVMAARDG